MEKEIDIHQIREILPHRYPFLLIDRVVSLTPGERLTAVKNVTANEPFFEGHFPDNPIVPGVVIVEAMAQTAGVVVSENLINKNDQSVLFMSINKAKFRKPVLPNYKIKFYVELMNNIKNVYKFMGRAYYNDLLVAESEFSAMITTK